MIISHSGRIFVFNFKAVMATVFKLNKYKNNWKLNYKVGIAVMKGTKTRVVLMVTKTNARRHPYIYFLIIIVYNLIKSMYGCMSSYHHFFFVLSELQPRATEMMKQPQSARVFGDGSERKVTNSLSIGHGYQDSQARSLCHWVATLTVVLTLGSIYLNLKQCTM